MSKKVLLIGLAVVAIAVPFAAPAIAGAIGIAGALGISAGLATALTAATLEIGLALTQSVLLGPSIPKGLTRTSPTDRLYAHLDTTTPRKIVFGQTAAATDVRYQEYTGDEQDVYHQVIALASHYVQSVDEIWIDNEVAWTLAGGPQGRFVDYFTVQVTTEGTHGVGISIGSTWDTDCTLTGCAWVHLQYSLIGPDESTPSPFQGGVSNRLTIRVNSMKLYDPRLDSSVAGGSGSHSSINQDTWQSTNNRNPALQLLWYLLGHKVGSSATKFMVGMGMPPARIDLPSFITAANICDESVSLSGGGSESRFRCDGVVSEGDDRQSVIDTLCAHMNATLRDAGGKISLSVLVNDLGSPDADFGLDDILGGEEWNQTPPLDQYFNVIRGRFVDASDDALYQLSEYPEASVTSPDGIERVQTIDFVMAQSASQCQRLAKTRLQRNQYQGRYTAIFGPRAWQVSVGGVVRMTHAGLLWTNKLFRVVEQTISRDGTTKMTLIEENSAIYAWSSTEQRAGHTPRTPRVSDPAKNPLVLRKGEVTRLIQGSWASGLSFSIAATGVTTVSNHNRVYPDKTVSVIGDTVSAPAGATTGDLIVIFYDDRERAGGAVTYQKARLAGGSGDLAPYYASSDHPYRHMVCAGHVPASGTTTGGSGTGTGTGGTVNQGGGGLTSFP